MMRKEFFEGTTRGVRIGFIGFVIALVAVSAGFFGSYVGSRPIQLVAFVATGIGVLIGFIGVAVGWFKDSTTATSGDKQAPDGLPGKLKKAPDGQKSVKG
jgi:hypothetical protein